MQMSREATKNHPAWPHHHLSILGVRRDAQGEGVGSELLRHFCDVIDARQANAYLETDSEDAMRLYERFGFREVNRSMRKGIGLIYMWRGANSTTTGPA